MKSTDKLYRCIGQVALWLAASSVATCMSPCYTEQPYVLVSVTSATDKTIRWDIVGKNVSAYTAQNVGDLTRNKQVQTELPLNLNAAETRYILQTNGTQIDTLSVRYEVRTAFVSQECGYAASVVRPAQGVAVRFSRDTLKGVYFNNETRPASALVGYLQGGAIAIQIGL